MGAATGGLGRLPTCRRLGAREIDEVQRMPFEQKGAEPLSQRITVRVSVDEHDRLREDADLAGLTLSEIVRRGYFARPILASIDRATVKELRRIQAELRRVGGLLKHVHVESNGSYSAQTAAALQTVNLTIGAARDFMEVVGGREESC
jgi:hypothetical protein